jgi:hypothetical protein
VKNALIKDGWTITHDPLILSYRDVLLEIDSERALYMAIPQVIFDGIFSGRLGQLMIKRQKLKLIVFNPSKEVVVQWIQ